MSLDLYRHFFKLILLSPKIMARIGNRSLRNYIRSPKTTNLNDIMTCYQQLFTAASRGPTEGGNTVSFPLGVITIPGEGAPEKETLREGLVRSVTKYFRDGINLSHCPSIVFPLLSESDGWTNGRPPIDLCDQYLAKLRLAVAILNAARVPHLDLRPENLMWRWVTDGAGGGGLELKVIDFEFALMFGQVVPEAFVHAIVSTKDCRYPFTLRPSIGSNLDARVFLANIELNRIVTSRWYPICSPSSQRQQ
jgi:serine/threonine protein kinase